MNAIRVYDDSVSLSAYKPNLKFAYSVFLWDFSPRITVGTAKQVLAWLYEAVEMAEALQPGIHIYADVRFQGEIMDKDDFIEYIKKVIAEIEKRVGDIKKSDKLNDAEVISENTPERLKLCLINIC